MTPQWYAIRTATRRERAVMVGLKEMRQEFELEADFYLPCETRWGPYQRDGKTRDPKDVPLLVGYLFVRMMPKDIGYVSEVFGVSKILDHMRDDGRRVPSPIPAEYVEKLRQAQADGKFDRTRGKSRAKDVERAAWKKLADLASMSEEERLHALAGFLGLKVEPAPEPEADYSAVMDERKAA